MYIRLKICGVTTLEDAMMTAEEGIDLIGFNFYPQSPRYIPLEKAAAIIKELPFHVTPIGILVRPSLSRAREVIQKSKVKALQIYEPQDFTDFSLLASPTILATSINTENILPYFYRMKAHMILIDNYSRKALGGTGRSFDWELIPADIPREKLILAGGIHQGNVLQALKTVEPAIVDIASGAEHAPGKKSRTKIKQLVAMIQEYNMKQHRNV